MSQCTHTTPTTPNTPFANTCTIQHCVVPVPTHHAPRACAGAGGPPFAVCAPSTVNNPRDQHTLQIAPANARTAQPCPAATAKVVPMLQAAILLRGPKSLANASGGALVLSCEACQISLDDIVRFGPSIYACQTRCRGSTPIRVPRVSMAWGRSVRVLVRVPSTTMSVFSVLQAPGVSSLWSPRCSGESASAF